MNSSPRIVVFKMREILYTFLLLFLVLLLVICLVLMFTKNNSRQTSFTGQNTEQTSENTEKSTSVYTPGVYTTPVTLGDSSIDVEVTVDSDRIHSIRLVNLSESMAASFPLISPSLEHIAAQILEKQSLDGITCPQENRYTAQLLLSAVADALKLAQNTP